MAEPRAERPRDGPKNTLDAGVVAYLGEACRSSCLAASGLKTLELAQGIGGGASI